MSTADKVNVKVSIKNKTLVYIQLVYLLSVKQFGNLSGPDRMSGLIWVQIVWKGYQQMTMSCKGLMQS